MSSILYRLSRIFVGLVLLGLFYLLLRGVSGDLFKTSDKHSAVMEQVKLDESRMEYPLSRLLVPVHKKHLKDKVDTSQNSWLTVRGESLFASKDVATFNANVSHNGLAEKLLQLYEGDARMFEWDKSKGVVKLKSNDKYLYVPSWIAFEVFYSQEKKK